MKELAGISTGLFDTMDQTHEEFVTEYFSKNEDRKELDKWLKKNRPQLKKVMGEMASGDFGKVRVTQVVPNTSKFDKSKVEAFIKEKGLYLEVTKRVVDDDKVAELIESGAIDIEELTKFAWIESTGSPRLTVKALEEG